MRLAERFDWGSRTYVMGILNVTPDSFSGDGLRVDAGGALDRAMAQARDFVDAGADILDVGGESTRPGSTPLSAEQEKERVLPLARDSGLMRGTRSVWGGRADVRHPLHGRPRRQLA